MLLTEQNQVCKAFEFQHRVILIMKSSAEMPSFCQRVHVRELSAYAGLRWELHRSKHTVPLSAVSLLFGFILWEVALHSDSDYKGFHKSWISALPCLFCRMSHSLWWGLSSPYFVQLLSNADKIPPSHKDSGRKERQRARASGDKQCSLPWTPCFETLVKLR